MTWKEFKELVNRLEIPDDAEVGVFMPFDPEGPSTYEKPDIWVEQGKVRITPAGL